MSSVGTTQFPRLHGLRGTSYREQMSLLLRVLPTPSQVLDQPQRIVDRGVRIARRDGIADPK
jgi:hypothetical protein